MVLFIKENETGEHLTRKNIRKKYLTYSEILHKEKQISRLHIHKYAILLGNLASTDL